MKRLFLLSATCIIMMLSANKANAYDFSAVHNGQTIYYNITSSTPPLTVAVTYYETKNYKSYSGSIDIPDNVTYNSNTYMVSAIGDSAFSGCSGLTSVTIGNSVITIGNFAFSDCWGLTGSLTLPNSVTSIGNFAFSACFGLTGSLTLPNSVTSIGDGAFFVCSGLTSVTLPNSVTTIGIQAFSYCSGLTSVTLPNTVTTIGIAVFLGCRELTSIIVDAGNPNYSSLGGVLFNKLQDTLIQYPAGKTGSYTLPNSVTTIGESAFYDCWGLTGSLILPHSVSAIGIAAFAGCSELTSIDVNADNPNYSSLDGVLFNKLQDTLIQCPAGKTGNYTIPNSITTIEENAFDGCSGLTSIAIPNSVISIRDDAFSRCSGLTSVTLPNSITTIGALAFYACNGLTSVIIPNLVTTIGYGTFSDCSGLTSLTIGNSVTMIGNYAFYSCIGLTEIHVKAENHPSLGTNVFYNVSDTIPVYVPCNKETIYKSARGWNYFSNIIEDCTGIEKWSLENQFAIYPNPATDNIYITLPENVRSAFFTLYDLQGKELIHQEVSNQDRVEVNGLASGIYIYHIKTNKENQTGKLRIGN